jgi:hypothetical protein
VKTTCQSRVDFTLFTLNDFVTELPFILISTLPILFYLFLSTQPSFGTFCCTFGAPTNAQLHGRQDYALATQHYPPRKTHETSFLCNFHDTPCIQNAEHSSQNRCGAGRRTGYTWPHLDRTDTQRQQQGRICWRVRVPAWHGLKNRSWFQRNVNELGDTRIPGRGGLYHGEDSALPQGPTTSKASQWQIPPPASRPRGVYCHALHGEWPHHQATEPKGQARESWHSFRVRYDRAQGGREARERSSLDRRWERWRRTRGLAHYE